MNSYFRFMTSVTGRVLRVMIGLALLAWGYSNFTYGDSGNAMLMTIGVVYALLGAANISLFGMMVGDSVLGREVRANVDALDGIPARPARPARMRPTHHEHIMGILNYAASHPKGWAVFRNKYRLSH